MPQPKKGPRLGSGPKHQRKILSNLAVSLFEHERVRTTEAKAKMLRPFAERLITKAKKGSVQHRRQVLSVIEDREVVHKLFADIAPRFTDRNGGYTRILKIGPRGGDAAPMALVELVEEGRVATTTADDDDQDGERKRRRLRAPRRRAKGDLPEDKPTRSRAAQASAEGTGPGADVEHPDQVTEEGMEAQAEAEESALEAEAEAASEQADADTGQPQKGGPGDVGPSSSGKGQA